MRRSDGWQDYLPVTVMKRLRGLGLKDAQIKTLLYLFVLGLLGLLLLRLPVLVSEPAGATVAGAPPVLAADGGWRDEERALERELEAVLALIRGAGRVRVSLVFTSSSEKRFGQNLSENVQRTEERDAAGTVRSTEVTSRTEQVVMARQGGQDEAVVTAMVRPQVAGAIVVAEGGGDSRTRAELIRALQALLGLPPHKIQVLPMGR
ncbi:MAG: hypothetical protein RDU89_01080 [bacterium]|nr:hypothetical protein [bacterium]